MHNSNLADRRIVRCCGFDIDHGKALSMRHGGRLAGQRGRGLVTRVREQDGGLRLISSAAATREPHQAARRQLISIRHVTVSVVPEGMYRITV